LRIAAAVDRPNMRGAILEIDTLVAVVVAHNKAGMRQAGSFGVL